MNLKKISIIFAIDENNGIGKNNKIPWDIKVDMTIFNNITSMTRNGQPTSNLKNAVIMGKNTWNSIGKQLPDRLNCVISSSLKQNDDILIFKDFNKAHQELSNMKNIDRIFVIGGAYLYNYVLTNLSDEYIDCIYMNEIYYDYNCDTLINDNLISQIMTMRQEYCEEYKVYDNSLTKKITMIFRKYSSIPTSPINKGELQYIQLLKNLIVDGEYRKTRNGSTWSLFNKQLVFNMDDGFPLLTSKKVDFNNVVGELLWFLRGDTNSKILEKENNKIWVKNTTNEFIKSVGLNYQEGDIGPMYGFQLRHYGENYEGFDKQYYGYDQIKYCLDLIKNDPSSRRIIMTTYNPKQAPEGVLYPCHGIVTQFYVNKNKLSLSTYQRSADVFLGLPWNIASYSLMLYIFCELVNNDKNYEGCKLKPGQVIINLGDYHLYEEHYDKAVIQILRSKERLYEFPSIEIVNKLENINDIKISDFKLYNYTCYKGLIADMKA
jgi:dihydrofolate reductase/thymidylate synthase